VEAQMKNKQIKSKEEKRRYWQGHIEFWQQSGLNQAEYCRRNSLPIKSFGYWKRRNSRSSRGQLNFFPLVLSNPVVRPGHTSLQLMLQEKRFTIEIKEDFSPTTLKKLILSLEEL
jgi:hypothetical protein